ncbi:hypothetical protein J4050_08840 [Winogradskyella sp. DF17]|uniref:Uncharacterized protein n=1 Tax=Winogradskyella pelagia TaxID=2819984 RepID=A0ABS3T278_9FLAO|nr:hypothetical protein [Winogradskyella sp. DF17]MBO3116851.1 hypothetical protein [Winogradskyella sp. DF17]
MNFKHKYLVILFVSAIFLSCSDDDVDNTTNLETAIDLVTGINAKQDTNSIFQLGNPNVRMPIGFTSLSIIAFPNPVNSALNISLSQTNEVITNVWLVRANAEKIFQDTDFDAIYTENTYTIDEVSQASIQEFNGFSNNEIILNLEGLDTGYYRVFIKTDDSLYWDNIYVDNDGVDITEFFDFWE